MASDNSKSEPDKNTIRPPLDPRLASGDERQEMECLLELEAQGRAAVDAQPLREPVDVADVLSESMAMIDRRIERHELAQVAEAERMRQREQDRRADTFGKILAGRGERYRNCRLASYRADTPAQREAVQSLANYLGDFEGRMRTGAGIILFGPAGTGKDHLLVAMLRAATIVHGVSAEWKNGMDLFGEMRDRMDAEQSERSFVMGLVGPQILAISDPLPPFGALTEFQASMLFRIIDGRYSQCRPTWITVNCASSQEAEQRLGAQVVDRLTEGALAIFCNWPSYRAGQPAERDFR